MFNTRRPGAAGMPGFGRRTLLGGAAATMAGLSRPALAGKARTLNFIPEGNLASPDPIWTTANVARIHGYMVWDTLYGVDEQLVPQPQLCAGHELSANGPEWAFTLRDGLRFHDGEAVTSRDCIASLQRWMKRDPIGQKVASPRNPVTEAETFAKFDRLVAPVLGDATARRLRAALMTLEEEADLGRVMAMMRAGGDQSAAFAP